MPEIQPGDTAGVKAFLKTGFGIADDNVAQQYAQAAVLMATKSEVKRCLALVSDAVEVEYRRLIGADNLSNVLTRSIRKVAQDLGWPAQRQVVFEGFIQPGDITGYIRNGLMWKDGVSSLHGEFTHSLQWLTIAMSGLGDRAAFLYQHSVDYTSVGKFRMPAGRAAANVPVWDFIVDCFNFGESNPDYKKDLITKSCRSPAEFNNLLFNDFKSMWIAAIIADRYSRRSWGTPVTANHAENLKEYTGQHHKATDGFTSFSSGAGKIHERADSARTVRARTARGLAKITGKVSKFEVFRKRPEQISVGAKNYKLSTEIRDVLQGMHTDWAIGDEVEIEMYGDTVGKAHRRTKQATT